MTGILTALQLVLVSLTAGQVATSEPISERGGEGPLRDALPLPLRAARIDALEAEDHYVRVHTSAGQALVRMRLADAMAAMSVREGLQPHRSWWVAQESVSAMSRSNGRTVLTLVGGQQVPVSRRARPLLGPRFCGIVSGSSKAGSR